MPYRDDSFDLGGDYAQDRGWSGGGARDDYTRERRDGAGGLESKDAPRSDLSIREEVNEALADDPYVNASHIEVAVAGCVVTLTGYVGSRLEKRAAEDCALTVRGVRDVMNAVRVTTGDREVPLGKSSE